MTVIVSSGCVAGGSTEAGIVRTWNVLLTHIRIRTVISQGSVDSAAESDGTGVARYRRWGIRLGIA